MLRHCLHFFFLFISFRRVRNTLFLKIFSRLIEFFFFFLSRIISFEGRTRLKNERNAKAGESFDLSKIKRRRGNRARQNPYRSIVRHSR